MMKKIECFLTSTHACFFFFFLYFWYIHPWTVDGFLKMSSFSSSCFSSSIHRYTNNNRSNELKLLFLFLFNFCVQIFVFVLIINHLSIIIIWNSLSKCFCNMSVESHICLNVESIIDFVFVIYAQTNRMMRLPFSFSLADLFSPFVVVDFRHHQNVIECSYAIIITLITWSTFSLRWEEMEMMEGGGEGTGWVHVCLFVCFYACLPDASIHPSINVIIVVVSSIYWGMSTTWIKVHHMR